MDQYIDLIRFHLSLKTNHICLFGAIAEFIDFSRTSGATELDIRSIRDWSNRESNREKSMLILRDNGRGMSTEMTRDSIISSESFISAAMRISDDFMIFTKTETEFTCLLLSRTFNEKQNNANNLIVPIVAFRSKDESAIFVTPEEETRHGIELAIILQNSPWTRLCDVMGEFSSFMFRGDTGTKCFFFNMKVNGDTPELSASPNDFDFIWTTPTNTHDTELYPEMRSLKAYISVLYFQPRMKVNLSGKKVPTKRLVSTIYFPMMSHYQPPPIAQDIAKKRVTFYFGVNVEDRGRDGIFVYCSSRLVKIIERTSPEPGKKGLGIIGIVDLEPALLELTQDKCDFVDAEGFDALIGVMKDHTNKYWSYKEMKQWHKNGEWARNGYGPNWWDPPSMDVQYVLYRCRGMRLHVQCDSCLQWRLIPYRTRGETLSIKWECEDGFFDGKPFDCSLDEISMDIGTLPP